jgi:hypothetical protein
VEVDMTDSPPPSKDQGAAERSSSEPASPTNPLVAAGRFRSDQLSATVISYLITGPALFGGLGHLADRWLGTGFLLPVGLVAGMAMSLYIIWLRYGTP